MSRQKNLSVVALQLKNKVRYQSNLDELLQYIEKYADHDLIVAPEVCLTDYDYENIEDAVKFSEDAIERLKEKIGAQTVVLTVLSKYDNYYTNDAVVIHNHRVVHRQSKHKLFLLGEEDKHLKAGKREDVMPFEIDGIKYGILICFEVRFKELWKQLEGVDIVLMPSQWGIERKNHLKLLPQALAVMNQCYVVVANSAKETMASSSAIYSPSGGTKCDDMLEAIEDIIDLSLIKKIRRYIVMR